MNNKFEDFINGRTYPKNEIINLLKKNNLDDEILELKYFPFKKIFVKVKKNSNENLLIKISLDQYSIDLSKNERLGYFECNKFPYKKFNLPEYKAISVHNNYFIALIEEIIGTKGNYFEFNKFYKMDFNQNFNYILVKDYLDSICSNLSEKSENEITNCLKLIVKNFKLKFGHISIPMDMSHGDFIHFNSIKSFKKKYIFDLEYFKKNRPYLHDAFHWFSLPLVSNVARYKKTKLLIYFLPFYLKRLINFFLKNYLIKFDFKDNNLFDILFSLYLIEKALFVNNQLNLLNIDELIGLEAKSLDKTILDIYIRLLLKLEKII